MAYSRSGTLVIESGPELDAAFSALLAGLRSRGRHTNGLRAHSAFLLAALDRAAQTPEGALFLAYRPTLKTANG